MKWIFAAFILLHPVSLTFSAEVSSSIPVEDRVLVEFLFKYLCYKDTFAYVLFGNKPMSMASEMRGESSDFELELAWKTWKKYSHLFDIKDFAFFTKSDEEWFSIFLINKKRCLEVIEENISLFQERLEFKSNPLEILDRVIQSDDIGAIGLNHSHTLLGILLGFGSKNSIGFERYHSNGPKIVPEASLSHIENLEFPVFIPLFISFSDQETNKLVDSYKKQRKEILDFLTEENVLETCLKRLTEH